MSISDILKVDFFKQRIKTLEDEALNLIAKNKHYDNELRQKDAIINELNIKISTINEEVTKIKSFTETYFPFYDLKKLIVRDTFEELQQLWTIWEIDIHNLEPQMLRQERACNYVLTPLDLDPSTASGHFIGRESDYHTSLVKCECMDFQRRILPCKHMYRLAYELDVFMLEDVKTHPDPKCLERYADILVKMNLLSSSNCEILEHVVYNYPCAVNLSSIKTLISLQLVQISNDKYCLLDSLKRDELFRHLPEDSSTKKNIKKMDLISLVINNYPQIITDIEKLTVPVEPHRYAVHLLPDIKKYLNNK